MKEIILSRSMRAIIDDWEFASVGKFKWSFMQNGYAYRQSYSNKKRECIFMHRLIAGAKKGEIVDHINGNKLDNRKSNLRICTRSDNAVNVKKMRRDKRISLYRGVFKNRSKWVAQVQFNGKKYCSGSHIDEKAAALAYNEMAKKYFGEHAYLNEVA